MKSCHSICGMKTYCDTVSFYICVHIIVLVFEFIHTCGTIYACRYVYVYALFGMCESKLITIS